jgi:hypothetical protein
MTARRVKKAAMRSAREEIQATASTLPGWTANSAAPKRAPAKATPSSRRRR